MKEYGSSVQKLVNYILTIADEEQRTKYAFLMVEVMKQIHPNMKDNTQDYTKKLWDDLYIMADFNLDVDNPFTTPDRTILFKKPRKMEYPQNDVRFRHYGKNIEKLVKEAVKKDDPKEDSFECAHRELEEETGYVTNQMEFYKRIYPCVGYSDEYIDLFIAKDCVKIDHPKEMDADENIECLFFNPEEIQELIDSDQIGDSKTLILLQHYLLKGKL